MYDRFGEEGLTGNGMDGGGMNAEDLFSSLFGGGLFGGSTRSRNPAGPRRGKDMAHQLKVSLEDLYNGKTSKLSLQKNVVCAGCSGKGGKEGAVKSCDSCRGTGVRVILRQMGPMIQQIQQACSDCNGEGEIIREKDRCKECRGRKIVEEKKILEVFIEKGMRDGQKITFNGEADQAPGIIPGDVVIVLSEKEHPQFTRKNDDLIYKADIDLLTALAGGQFTIEHLDKRILLVTVIPGEIIEPGAVKVISGEGMPIYRHSHDNGNLYIQFNVIFPPPASLTPDKLTLLEQALPARPALPQLKGKEVDEYGLASVDPNQQAGGRRGTGRAGVSPMEEDSGDEHHHGMPGVQCQQQ
jgi:DnaJ family protein A protein 2